MKNVRLREGHVQCHVFALPDTALACGLAGVAIRTTDLALCDFYEDGRPSETCLAYIRDIVALVAQVVELEDNRVSLSAVDTWVLGEVLPHPQLVLISR